MISYQAGNSHIVVVPLAGPNVDTVQVIHLASLSHRSSFFKADNNMVNSGGGNPTPKNIC